jgi:DNA-binding transcriptional LysR family regulator
MMNIGLIKRFVHFLAVVEEGHFGRAAARLGISQPPLTAQIQALERDLGVRILDRSRRGTRPTWEGEVLLPAVRRLEESARAVEALAREVRAGKRGLIRIGCVTSAMFEILPPVVQAFRAAHPEIVVSVREMDTTIAHEALRLGEVDVAFARLERDRFPVRISPVATDLLIAALSPNDPLAANEMLDLAVLEGRPMIVLPRAISPAYFDGLTGACRAAGFAPVAAIEVTSAIAQLALVASGLGVALVSSGMACLAPPGVVFRSLRKPAPAVGVAVAWNEERDTELVRAIVTVVENLKSVPPPAGFAAGRGGC